MWQLIIMVSGHCGCNILLLFAFIVIIILHHCALSFERAK